MSRGGPTGRPLRSDRTKTPLMMGYLNGALNFYFRRDKRHSLSLPPFLPLSFSLSLFLLSGEETIGALRTCLGAHRSIVRGIY